jgi:hypothetical protein
MLGQMVCLALACFLLRAINCRVFVRRAGLLSLVVTRAVASLCMALLMVGRRGNSSPIANPTMMQLDMKRTSTFQVNYFAFAYATSL